MAGFLCCNIILIRKYCREESVMSLAVGVMFVSASLGILFFEFFYIENIYIEESPFVFIGWPLLTFIVFSFVCRVQS